MRDRRNPHPNPPHKGEGVFEKTCLALGLLVFFGAGYFGIGFLTDPARAHSLATPLDTSLPFIAGFLWIYIWVIPAAPAPLFLVKSQRLYRRAILAYALTIVISYIVFVIYPVSAASLRATASLDTSRLTERMVAVLYRVDPVANAFPSLHLALATLAAIAAWKVNRAMGVLLGLSVPAVAISVCLVKQHFVLDVIAGIALALAIGLPLIGSYRPESDEVVGYSWGGPVLFFAFAGFSYAVVTMIGMWFPL